MYPAIVMDMKIHTADVGCSDSFDAAMNAVLIWQLYDQVVFSYKPGLQYGIGKQSGQAFSGPLNPIRVACSPACLIGKPAIDPLGFETCPVSQHPSVNNVCATTPQHKHTHLCM